MIKSNNSYEEITFRDLVYEKSGFESVTFEGCTFMKCQFQECDFTDTRFIDCKFQDSDLSLSKFHQFQFVDCKVMNSRFIGIDWRDVQEATSISIDADRSVFDFSVWVDNTIESSKFRDCSFNECRLSECALIRTSFEGCDGKDMVMSGGSLEGCSLIGFKGLKIRFDTVKFESSKISEDIVKESLESIGVIIV